MAYGNELNIERVPVKVSVNQANSMGFSDGLAGVEHPARAPGYLVEHYKAGFEFGKSCLGAQFEMGRIQVMSIHEELVRIQKELRAPKNQYNNFGKYYFRSCEDILEGVKAVAGKCSVTINDDVIMVGDRIYIKATASLNLDGESVTSTAMAREAESKKGMDESMITGTASSYARKYALNGLFAIDDNKDADMLERVEDKLEEIETTEELTKFFNSLTDEQKKKATKKFAARSKAIKAAKKEVNND